MNGAYEGINAAWRSACKVLLGQEIGGLQEYEKFLKRYVEPVKKAKSSLSGKDVYYGAPYSPEARFISQDEMGQLKVAPLEMDDLKDIDSLLDAVSERIYYSGNKLGGQIHGLHGSEDCSDAVNVFDSVDIYMSENIAYSQMQSNSKYMFGCSWGTHNNFCINMAESYKAVRCFESTLAVITSDAHYCYNCNGCQELLFCINQKSKRYAIGNRELPKDRYSAMKKKILDELGEMLKKDKTAPSHIDVFLGRV